MMLRAALLALTALAAAAPDPARAQADSRRGASRDVVAQAGVPSRALLDQKAALLRKLIADSPMAQRIQVSDSAEAKAYAAEAMNKYQQALPLLQANDLVRADALLVDGIALMGKARKLVPEPSSRDLERRARYVQLLESVQSLSAAYERRGARSGGDARPRIDAPRNQTSEAIARAKELGDQGRYGDAVRILEEASAPLMRGLSTVLGTDSVEYAPRFADAAEEFDYELERNREYAALVPIAVAELQPSAAARAAVDAHVADSGALRQAAREQAARREFPAALVSLRQSTLLLQRALAASGLIVPTSEASQR